MMKKRLLIVVLLATIFSFSAAFADSIIASNPGGHAAFNAIPFSSESGTGRYQEIYSSSLFSGPVQITSLAFSPADSVFYAADVTLRLTTTNVAVGALSPNLDSNFITPLTTVYANPNFSESLTGGSESFSLVFNFATPFTYDPNSGNLLFDLLISNQNVAEAFSRSGSGPILSRAFDTAGFGDNADGVGLRTLIGFQTSAVPEPGTILLMGTGLVGLAATLRRKLIL